MVATPIMLVQMKGFFLAGILNVRYVMKMKVAKAKQAGANLRNEKVSEPLANGIRIYPSLKEDCHTNA